MPSLSELPSDINIKKFLKSLESFGFIVSKSGGKGSHFKVTYMSTQKSLTIPSKFSKNVLYYVLKEIRDVSGVEWGDIKNKM